MPLRRKKLIDKRFQLKTTFSIISITLITFLILIAYVAVTATNNNRKIVSTVNELDQAIVVEDNIVNAFIDYSKRISNNNLLLHSKKISEDHNKSISVIREYATLLKSFVRQNLKLITVIIVIVFIQSVVLFFYLISITHRISGPIYVISRHIQDIAEGKEPQYRELRDKDEFKEFYEKFWEMAENISQVGKDSK